MESKKYLLQVQRLEDQIQEKKERIEYYIEKTTSIPGSFKGADYIRTSSHGAGSESLIIAKVTLEQEVKADVERLKRLKQEVTNTMNKLGDKRTIQILQQRYFERLSWRAIAHKYKMSERHVYRIATKALNDLDTILKNDIMS